MSAHKLPRRSLHDERVTLLLLGLGAGRKLGTLLIASTWTSVARITPLAARLIKHATRCDSSLYVLDHTGSPRLHPAHPKISIVLKFVACCCCAVDMDDDGPRRERERIHDQGTCEYCWCHCVWRPVLLSKKHYISMATAEIKRQE